MAIGLVLIRYCTIQVFWATSHTLSVQQELKDRNLWAFKAY
jgi:hypothetical protein